MVQGQAQFCGTCGSPRVAGASECPDCHSPYGELPNLGTPPPEQTTRVPPPPPGGYIASAASVAPPPGAYPSSGPYPSAENPTQVVGSQPAPISPLPGAYPPAVVPTPQSPVGKSQSGGKLVIANTIAIMILFVVVAGLLYHDVLGTGSQASIAPTATSASGAATAGTNPTGTPVPGATRTPGANPSATAPASSTSGYSASLPGPGCDTRGGIWTPKGLDGISCPTQSGTALVINATGARGYLYFQLPNNQAFAPNNTSTITATLGENSNGYQAKCVGLAEVDANTGFSAEFCNTGQWFIYSISNDGSILQTLDKNVSNTLTGAKISLSISGSTLTFSVNSAPVDAISMTPIQPTRIAIVYDCVGYGANSTIGGNSLLVNNFTYSPASS